MLPMKIVVIVQSFQNIFAASQGQQISRTTSAVNQEIHKGKCQRESIYDCEENTNMIYNHEIQLQFKSLISQPASRSHDNSS